LRVRSSKVKKLEFFLRFFEFLVFLILFGGLVGLCTVVGVDGGNEEGKKESGVGVITIGGDGVEEERSGDWTNIAGSIKGNGCDVEKEEERGFFFRKSRSRGWRMKIFWWTSTSQTR